MEASTIVGAIGIIATLCAPFIGVRAASWSKNRDLKKIPGDRKAALEGYWVGTGIQKIGPGDIGPFPTKVFAKCKVSTKEVVGDFNYQYELASEKISLDMKLTGGFLYDRYLRLHYNTQQASVVNFGSAVLQLSDSGTTLSGRFLGYGSNVEGLVSGSIELHKQL